MPSEEKRQCWTLPPPDRSITVNQGFDKASTSSSHLAPGLNSPIRRRMSVNLAQSLFSANRVKDTKTGLLGAESQTPLAIRLMRDSERRELERTDVFSQKNQIRQPLVDIAVSPIRLNNSHNSLDEPTSPFIKCLLSNTPAKLPTKISVMSPATYGYNNPPKLRRLSIQGDVIELKPRQPQEGHSIERQDPHAPVEKLSRPLPNIQGEVEFEVISSPVSPLRDRDLLFISEEAEEECTVNCEAPSSSPIRSVDVDDPFTTNKRQKVSK
ncbi:hypothetical protein K7432_002762 [Basidiobolus ranarum]|uniref:Uncharacterized protein n=1 Tax=Basidiobolus ranarum TaxID=34480 RepID=A0ABR2X125_9FUNG